ncbi:MAG: hypothetical protein AAGH19_02525 [Pseudomonadota bacterium]
MEVFIITFLVLALVVVGMAVGVIAGRPAIKGSCGGLNVDGKCRFCENAGRCER